MSRRASSIFIVLVLIVWGCTSSKEVTIYSSPGSARVLVDSTVVGTTPYVTKVSFQKGDYARFTLQLDGYLDSTLSVPKEPKSLATFTVPLKKKATVEIQLVSFVPVQTKLGVKLERQTQMVVAYLEVIERSPNVKSVTRVTNNNDYLTQLGEPVLSPTTPSVVYSTFVEEDGNAYSNLWMQTIGGVGRTRITFGNSIDLYPTFTHDGEFIYFSSDRLRKNPGIWRINTSGGGGLTSITNTDADDFGVSMFPRNEVLAYTSIPYGAEEPQIWTIRSNGTLPTQLREGRFPDISPDGRKILFVRDDLGTVTDRNSFVFNPTQVWVMNADGSVETQLTQNVDHNNIQPRWSPDGNWIVYASDEGKDSRGVNNFDIWMMRADGTRKTQLTTNGSWDDSPTWSKDGRRIYFRSNRGGAWNIWYFEPTI